MKGKYLSLNGQIVPYAEARIHVSSVAMKYGASVFEGIRGYWNEQEGQLYAFALDGHLQRLLASMKLMGMEHEVTVETLREQTLAVIRANELREDCYIRLAASIEIDGPIDSKGPVLINIAAFPQGRKPQGERGIRVNVSSWVRIADHMMPPRIKSVANYQNGRLAALQAKADGYDNTLLLNQSGKIAEAPTAAFFLVKNGVLITPPTTAGILESITRRCLLEWARDLGIPTQEREIDRTECYLAEEAFLCGTGAEILPIGSIDRHLLGEGRVGPITRQLTDCYFAAAYGRSEFSRHLNEPVYGV